jgi:hypothetical protein
MAYQQSEQELDHARHALDKANPENIVDLCKRYLTLLEENRRELYELGKSGISRQTTSSSSVEELAARKSLREAIEKTTRERNRTEMLLLSITTVSGYEAVQMLNQRRYDGHDDWELRSSGVKSTGSSVDDLMTIQEAVDLASLLRREDHVTQNTARASGQGQA